MRFVAFLRAINVGGRNVKMEQLRRIFESVGLTNVETVIASGNVVFEARTKNARTIEKKLQGTLRRSRSAMRSRPMSDRWGELMEIANHNPFKKIPKNGTLFIAFASDSREHGSAGEIGIAATKTDKFWLPASDLLVFCLTRFSNSKFSGPSLEKTLGVPITVRTFGTIAKIAAKCADT